MGNVPRWRTPVGTGYCLFPKDAWTATNWCAAITASSITRKAVACTCRLRKRSTRLPACAVIQLPKDIASCGFGSATLHWPILNVCRTCTGITIPQWAGDGKTIHAKCNYKLVLDNLMDLTHETFVHGSSIGNRAVAEAPFTVTHGTNTATVTRWMLNIDPPPFWAGQLGKPGKVDRWQIIRFEAPSTIAIDVGVAPAGSGAPEGDRSHGVNGYVLNTVTPETGSTCHYFWAFARNYRIGEQSITTELCEGVAQIFREDERILEAQQLAMEENPGRTFYNLNIDAGAMWMRRLIDETIRAESKTNQETAYAVF